MKFKKIFQLALNILIHSKLRSWLTIIGIVIGIGAVVSIVSISEGARQSLEERLSGLGTDILTISPGFDQAIGRMGSFRHFNEIESKTNDIKNLTDKDILVLKNIKNIKLVSGEVSDRGDIAYLSKSANINIKGVDITTWKDITTEKLISGRYLTNGDSFSVILGKNLVDSTFEKKIQLNSKVTIEGKSFKVVGILEEGSSIYIPLEIARDILENIGDKEYTVVYAKMDDVDSTDETIEDLTKKLMFSRGILSEKDRDFSVYSPKTMQKTMQSTLNTMSLFLGAIAAISLLVGAIGIANTMFTSVLERTREIGIMKAIGAKDLDILFIFLFNSGMIGLVGGIGGIIIGSIGSSLISYMGSTAVGEAGRIFSNTYISLNLLLFALFFSMIIGMISGLIPAYRASKLDPVESLRYE